MNPFAPTNVSSDLPGALSRWRFLPAAICLLIAVFFVGNAIVVATMTVKSIPDVSSTSKPPIALAASLGVLVCVLATIASLYSAMLSLRGRWARAMLLVAAMILAIIVVANLLRAYLEYAVPKHLSSSDSLIWPTWCMS
ncbi:hypothetical protein Poly59_61650 [Rubripirellula reticaptiva]|uniref:Uncharacterized protein n=1 Tax=Rubripirellula reticaptiva TaxID=2528013 RepID=A0A5C6EAB3_9BACT|nr:hypothetical protein Poly59_61650 [Rubripirellula reticaptiva]